MLWENTQSFHSLTFWWNKMNDINQIKKIFHLSDMYDWLVPAKYESSFHHEQGNGPHYRKPRHPLHMTSQRGSRARRRFHWYQPRRKTGTMGVQQRGAAIFSGHKWPKRLGRSGIIEGRAQNCIEKSYLVERWQLLCPSSSEPDLAPIADHSHSHFLCISCDYQVSFSWLGY